jgi:hypothetical protein
MSTISMIHFGIVKTIENVKINPKYTNASST